MSQSDPRNPPQNVRDDCGRDELDDFILAFEDAYRHRGGADPAAFLPPPGHPLHGAVLRELVRVDLEFGWERGCPKTLDAYQRDFPQLAADSDALQAIAFEEYRLRRQAGQVPSPDEYQARYGVTPDPASGRLRSVSWFRSQLQSQGGSVRLDRSGGATLPAWEGWRPPRAIPTLPEVGDEFLGFRLIGDLGHGSFGRVYLARQGELADRAVVLKVTADCHDEARTLAQLQHDHIVPIYSRHRRGTLQAVCMPYLGAVTLRDVLEELKIRGTVPGSGQDLLSSLTRSSARKNASSQMQPASGSRSGWHSGPSAAAGDPGGAPDPAARSAQARWPGTATPPGAEAEPSAAPPSAMPPAAPEARTVLSGLSYVEAVVWMAARVARGLAHAHERGILHRDLKPANILLTDDGRPMLLDFNLAADTKAHPTRGDGAALGGTLPYMAPEHLEAFRGGGREVDARSDLFALGVILYEMLTGRPPFPLREASGGKQELLRAMIADRQGAPPLLRPFNPAVSPAVESLVRHCLEADPARRYATAGALAEDLERQLAHRPLKYAPEPSTRERAAKWARRNASLLAMLGVLAVLGGLAAALAATHDRFARYDAEAALMLFHTEGRDAHSRLAGWLTDPSQGATGLAAARQALGLFHVLDDGPVPWWDCPPAARLSASERDDLRREAGELLLLVARGETLRPKGATASKPGALDPAHRAAVQAALRTSEQAERCFLPGAVPRSLWVQRSELLADLGDLEAAARFTEQVRQAPRPTAVDLFHTGLDQARAGAPAEAVRLFEAAIRLDPAYYWTWLSKGICHAQLRDDAVAEMCFSTCIALARGNSVGWFLRGALHLRLGRLSEAEADLDAALRLCPDDPDVLIDRALVDLKSHRPAEAVARLTRVIERGTPYSRVYLMRAEARTLAGDLVGARLDRTEGLRRKPGDAMSWAARANARATGHDLDGALEDLDQALKILPDDFTSLWNKSAYLSEQGRNAEAVQVLDRLAVLYPAHAPVRGMRGVLHARLGDRAAALADVEFAMALSRGPESLYQAACVHALSSRTHPDDRAEALHLLGVALKNGFGLQIVDHDHDLDPVRDDPTFRPIVDEARVAARGSPASSPPPAPAAGSATSLVSPARSTSDRSGPATAPDAP